jgi:hypothetical protein
LISCKAEHSCTPVTFKHSSPEHYYGYFYPEPIQVSNTLTEISGLLEFKQYLSSFFYESQYAPYYSYDAGCYPLELKSQVSSSLSLSSPPKTISNFIYDSHDRYIEIYNTLDIPLLWDLPDLALIEPKLESTSVFVEEKYYSAFLYEGWTPKVLGIFDCNTKEETTKCIHHILIVNQKPYHIAQSKNKISIHFGQDCKDSRTCYNQVDLNIDLDEIGPLLLEKTN